MWIGSGHLLCSAHSRTDRRQLRGVIVVLLANNPDLLYRPSSITELRLQTIPPHHSFDVHVECSNHSLLLMVSSGRDAVYHPLMTTDPKSIRTLIQQYVGTAYEIIDIALHPLLDRTEMVWRVGNKYKRHGHKYLKRRMRPATSAEVFLRSSVQDEWDGKRFNHSNRSDLGWSDIHKIRGITA